MTADRKRKASAPSGSASTSTARKTPSKAPAKKSSAAKKADAPSQTRKRRASAPRAESKPLASAAEVAERAVNQLSKLTGKTAEGVTGVEQSDDGWRVTVEVLEVRRIPETTDVLARYEIEADDKGDLTGYRRAGRYTRGSARED